MRELVVISGKGGTGKTSLVAGFAALARDAVLADCDVDAPDLHLVLEPAIEKREPFIGGEVARVDSEMCINCGTCRTICRFDAISDHGPANEYASKTSMVDPIACEGCGVCMWLCPEGAIELRPAANGELYTSRTRFGPMVHAQLGVAQGNSGKLVTAVRTRASDIATSTKARLVLTDGPPGTGCPVIASITGADAALIVVEPTLSAIHDMNRVVDLLRHFRVPGLACVNKWDVSPALAEGIHAFASGHGLVDVGQVRYDDAVTGAQLAGLPIVDYTDEGSAHDVREVWERVQETLAQLERAPATMGHSA